MTIPDNSSTKRGYVRGGGSIYMCVFFSYLFVYPFMQAFGSIQGSGFRAVTQSKQTSILVRILLFR